jgi:hypothetical protein
MMRIRAAAFDSPPSRRDSLMNDFTRLHQRRTVPAWVWTLSAAAVVLIALFFGREVGLKTRARTTSPAIETEGARTGPRILYEASADASELSSEDFIAVPYAPPLVTGEVVRIVHADLYPEVLASLGVGWTPASAGDVPVEVVVGEDGLPRAVRITENSQF